MKRREFITLLGGAAAWPITTRAQQPAMPVIGFLHSESADLYAPFARAFRQGLIESGYVEGRNVTIEYRWADGQYDRLPAMAADLIRRQVTVIAANSPAAVLAAKAGTTTIPIVFNTGYDPVAAGLVASLSRPGGNLTGITSLTAEVGPKRVELLHELLPTATSIALLVNPAAGARHETISTSLQGAARKLSLQTHVLHASAVQELEAVFARLAQLPIGGLNGGSLTGMYHQSGVHTGRVLKGEKPAELPVQQATKVELIINLKTARAFGLTIPLPLLGRADEVIE
jgi:putative ABC transport system substrate-binding protein